MAERPYRQGVTEWVTREGVDAKNGRWRHILWSAKNDAREMPMQDRRMCQQLFFFDQKQYRQTFDFKKELTVEGKRENRMQDWMVGTREFEPSTKTLCG